MKAKLLLTALFLLSFLENSYCQEYHPLLDNSVWIVRRTVSCCEPSYTRTISQKSDTIVAGHTYIGYNDPFVCSHDQSDQPVFTVYMREDISEKKIYKLVDGVDTLLYDYNMDNGDTISQYGYTWTATVDEIAVNTGMRKRITLHSIEQYYNHTLTQVWIEGIGSSKHPFFPENNMENVVSAGGGQMLSIACVYQNGVHVFGSDNCDALLSTTNQVFSAQKIVFSPNPVSTQILISSESNLQNATFKLFDAGGKLIREASNLNGRKVSVSRENLSKGRLCCSIICKW